ncbi:Glutamyl-tRNA reductase [Halanaeroarchaeum sp. HSR-CO]|uniref:glutamyl-tRNA reductase n=1 Tax=Halanaeroarchaeum sp. HSR-CO TaxID=2866382 RepID=UPI00217D37F0|nr:glutamyl-tRNA reductase [Halanaeroarchaeum sp. HSR-CO]UWG49082.1 Glutamyl-tRNA reductase [Halanaeroarchaeum sp. HSR-CO]
MEALHGAFVTHRRASLSTIEAARSVDVEATRERLLAHGASEAFVLQTCNRVELYVRGPPTTIARELDRIEVPEEVVDRAQGEAVARHALQVAAGLESMVVGEDEILGQFSTATEQAREDLGGPLETVLDKAIRTGKRVRSETAINEGHASMGTAAVDLANRRLEGLSGATALVVGAGEMGRSVAGPLADRGAEVLVTNRTYETARELADAVGATATCFDSVASRFPDVDVLFSATDAPHRIFEYDDLHGERLLAIDLANPRDIDDSVAEASGIDLYDIDDIGAAVDESIERRESVRDRAEAIVESELDQLADLLKRRRADEMLGRIYSEAERIRREETERAIDCVDADVDEAVFEQFASSIVNRLLATPTKSIKEAAADDDYETLETVSTVFQIGESAGHRSENAASSPSIENS